MCISSSQCDKCPVTNYQLHSKWQHTFVFVEKNVQMYSACLKTVSFEYFIMKPEEDKWFWKGRASLLIRAIINHLIGLLFCWWLLGFHFWWFSTKLYTVELTAFILYHFHSSFTVDYFIHVFFSIIFTEGKCIMQVVQKDCVYSYHKSCVTWALDARYKFS